MKISTELIEIFLSESPRNGSQDVVEALKLAGVEIEESRLIHFDSGLVLVEIVSVLPHPNADKLRLAMVNDGSHELQIVCGATNIRPGQIVALAKVGTQLPDGTTIKAVSIRGVESQGMLCSGKELAINEDHSGIFEFSDLEPGTKVAEVFPTSHVIDVKTAANRPDLQSALGLAREVAAHLGSDFNNPKLFEYEKQKPLKLINNKEIPVEVISYSVTRVQIPQYTFLKPDPMTERSLLYAGMPSISPVVDITNFAMIQTGQPLHAFDARKVTGKVSVRFAHEGEKLIVLGGKKLLLTTQDLVIVDEAGPIALAGIIGGEDTAVDDKTTTVLLESATFDATTIRKSALRHGLRTEASSRFERGLPVEFAWQGLACALGYLGNLPEATVDGLDYYSPKRSKTPNPITLFMDKLSGFIGIPVSKDVAKESLERLGFKVSVIKRKEALQVSIPFWRPDIHSYQDLYEEVIKIVGLESIPELMPVFAPKPVQPDLNRKWLAVRKLRQALKAAGAFEVNNYPFISPDLEQFDDASLNSAPGIKNPISIEQKLLRKSLLPSLLKNLKDNRKHSNRHTLYEIARVFLAEKGSDTGVIEKLKLGLVSVDKSYSSAYDTIKGIFDSLLEEFSIEGVEIFTTHKDSRLDADHQGEIYHGEELLGVLGGIEHSIQEHFKILPAAYLEVDVLALLRLAKAKQYLAPPKYQVAKRDITVLIGSNQTWQSVREVLEKIDGLSAEFKDEYYSPDQAGSKALSIHLEFFKSDSTLKMAEISKREQTVIEILERDFGAKIKS